MNGMARGIESIGADCGSVGCRDVIASHKIFLSVPALLIIRLNAARPVCAPRRRVHVYFKDEMYELVTLIIC